MDDSQSTGCSRQPGTTHPLIPSPSPSPFPLPLTFQILIKLATQGNPSSNPSTNPEYLNPQNSSMGPGGRPSLRATHRRLARRRSRARPARPHSPTRSACRLLKPSHHSGSQSPSASSPSLVPHPHPVCHSGQFGPRV